MFGDKQNIPLTKALTQCPGHNNTHLRRTVRKWIQVCCLWHAIATIIRNTSFLARKFGFSGESLLFRATIEVCDSKIWYFSEYHITLSKNLIQCVSFIYGCKVYSNVLEEIVMNYLEENNVLGEVQGAFRKGRRTEDHIFTLQGIIVLLCCIRKSKKCKTYLAFLDLCKAFDRVWHYGIFYLLWKNGIHDKCWKFLKSLYSKVSNTFVFGQHETEFFDQEFGFKQDVFFPLPFSQF
jgi:hypothetical protein